MALRLKPIGLVVALGVASASGQSPDQASKAGAGILAGVRLPADLDRVLRDYERAWAAKDAKALASLFHPAGMALPNFRPPVTGLPSLEAEFRTHAGGPLSLRAFSFARFADRAYIIGGYASSPTEPDMGKFVLLLKRGHGGTWKILADMDNANAAPQRKP